MNKTLFNYIFVKQLKTLIFVAFSIFSLILLFEFAEVSRQYPITNILELLYVLKLSILRCPITFCEILHYIYFLTATFSLWDLCRSHQITILKSTGKSPRQILLPFIIFAVTISLFWLFILHPIGILSENIYKRNTEKTLVSSFEMNNNIWIDYGTNNQIIFIKKLYKNEFHNFFSFDLHSNKKIFAESGKINNNYLTLSKASIFYHNEMKFFEKIRLANAISPKLISLLSLPPQRQTIYSLYKIHEIKKTDKVNIRLYELALHKLLANCASFWLFAIFAAVICFPINRYKTKANIAIKVISVALILKFANNIMDSLAYTGITSVVLSAWAATLILMLLAISILIWKEV